MRQTFHRNKQRDTIRVAEKQQHGFIALISAIIISSILVGLLLTSASSGLSVRIDALHTELKRQSEHLANSCVHTALLNIAENYSYIPKPGGDTVTIDTDTCIIDSVQYGIENLTTHTKTAIITTHAQFRNTWTRLQVQASVASPLFTHPSSLQPITILSWQEI